MKKCLYALTVVSFIGFAGCQKLDREFVTTIGQEEIEASFQNVQSLLTALYSEIPDGLVYISGTAMLASGSDEAEFTLETNPIQAFNTGNWNAVTNPDFVWGSYYRGIRRTNQFLQSTGKVNLDPWKLNPSASSQAVYQQNLAAITRWKYEARFLRAFFYFELVKRYGGVPILNEALPVEGDFSNVKRAPLAQCIQFISDECDSAAAQLPLTANTPPYATGTDLGRATKIAALALKSRLLLYAASDLFNSTSWAGGYANTELISLPAGDRNARWKAAADAAKAVIDAAAVPGLGAYKALFNTYNNAEIILARINSTGGSNNTFERNNSPIGFPGGQSGNTPSGNLVDAYEVRINATTSVPFDWNNPTHTANPYANRDPRLALSIVTNNTSFGTPARNVQLWNGGLDGKPLPNASKTGYYLRKYIVESLNILNNNTATHSWILFRYPEIYLNYAEALNEWSPGAADIKINYDRVRNRTGVTMPLLPAGLSQSQVRDRIRAERQVELAFEDHRLWDARRWLQGPAILGAPLRGVDVVRNTNGTFSYTPFVVEPRVFQPRMYLYPIPQSDINIAQQLIQNPGW